MFSFLKSKILFQKIGVPIFFLIARFEYIKNAKQNTSNTVGRKELQAFVGAMENIQKGVFITSSSFTNEARNFVKKQQQKNIKLIDGNYLADLLIRYEVGINRVQNFTVHKIDFDYYGE